jgi:hypothetical protein
MANATFADLFSTDLLLHYDVSDASKLFTDTGGTSAASNGNEVKCIKPQSDAALAVNLTNSAGPTYRSNYASSGYAALEFDGVNDALVNASTGLTAGVRFFVLVVMTPIAGAGTAWSRGTSASHFCRLYINTAPSYLGQSVGGANTFSQSATFASGKICLAMNLGDNQNQIDGLGQCIGTQQTGTVSASLAAKFSLGVADFSGLTQFGNFAFHELLLIGQNCEWGQVLRGAKILRNKWGVTDPNALPQAGGTSRPLSPFLSQVIG